MSPALQLYFDIENGFSCAFIDWRDVKTVCWEKNQTPEPTH